MTVSREMPRYQCHKRVWALRIKEVEHREVSDEAGPIGGRTYLIPDDSAYAPVPVTDSWYERQLKASRSSHDPMGGLEGGYYVVYADGYASWSPAEAFESGYTRIEL